MSWRALQDLNLRRPGGVSESRSDEREAPAEIPSEVEGPQGWWALQDLNLGPTDYESAALTAELRAPRLILQYRWFQQT